MSEATGNTENELVEPQTEYIHINEIYDELYDPEMDYYIFEFITYSGRMISLRLKQKDIDRFVLFMNKEKADQRYIKHIMNN
jgi:hypothetical protein